MNRTAPSELLRDWVDIERYPIDDLDSPAGQRLVQQCRASLAKSNFFALPGFITPEASALMAGEAEDLLPESHFMKNRRTVYQAFENECPEWPPEHPRNHALDYQCHIIGYDWIPDTCAIRKLYQSDALPRFLSAALEVPTLYHFDDAYQATTLLVHEEGEGTPWHFDDNNDFTVTLLLQSSVAGGDFELVADIRNAEDENYDGLRRLFDGDERDVVTVPRHGGEIVVFQGRHSIHRVTPVQGDVRRIIAIMTFVDQPGLHAPLEVNRGAYGPRVRPHRSEYGHPVGL